MKRIPGWLLLAVLCLSLAACSVSGNMEETQQEADIVPQVAQMKSICELATMKCYYHNVAKYYEEDASGILWWKKDRYFWIEYSGVVMLGIDTSRVDIHVEGENVTITLPPAEVLGCKVDDETLTEDSFIVAGDSAKVEAEHQRAAFAQAQEKMMETAKQDTVLLANAQQRAQKLLEDYVHNIGTYTGKTYSITWVFLDGAGNPDCAEESGSSGV